MGKFSGILICSDFDGTLASKAEIPEINIEKIKYFCENGGCFSIITGRGSDFFIKYRDVFDFETYMGCTNGTVICHFPSGEIVLCDYLRDEFYDRIISLCDKIDKIKSVELYPDGDPINFSGSTEEIKKALEEARGIKIHKIVVRTAIEATDDDVALSRAHMGEACAVSRSWKFGIEFQNGSFHKGVAAHNIAKLLGTDTLITVGDFENDIPLLMAGDESYATQNALDAVKEVASHVLTRTSAEGAIAELIDILDKRI